MHGYIGDDHLLLSAAFFTARAAAFTTFPSVATLALDDLLFFLLDRLVFDAWGVIRDGRLQARYVDKVHELVDVLARLPALAGATPLHLDVEHLRFRGSRHEQDLYVRRVNPGVQHADAHEKNGPRVHVAVLVRLIDDGLAFIGPRGLLELLDE